MLGGPLAVCVVSTLLRTCGKGVSDVSVGGGIWSKGVSSKCGRLVSMGDGDWSWKMACLRGDLVLNRRRGFCPVR